jgi:polysaccharide pyruvyl transferase WcaK-like protein
VKRRKVLLLGSYGRGNVGDDAFLFATIRLLSDHDLTINSASDHALPREAKGKVTTLPTDIKRGWKQIISAVTSADAVVYGGGDLWVELFGDKYPRQALWKMVILNTFARLTGKKVIYLGCGAGRLDGFSRTLARASALLAHGIVVRDKVTAQVLGVSRTEVLPDLTSTLFEQQSDAPRDLVRPVRILVSPMYYIPSPEENFQTYISGLAEVLNRLEPEKYEVRLLPMLTDSNTKHNDIWSSEQLIDQLNNGLRVQIADATSIDQCLAALKWADVIVATRLHASILGTWLGKPSLGISYRPKVKRFFDEIGLPENCVDISTLQQLGPKILNIAENYDEAIAKVMEARNRTLTKAHGYKEFVKKHL